MLVSFDPMGLPLSLQNLVEIPGQVPLRVPQIMILGSVFMKTLRMALEAPWMNQYLWHGTGGIAILRGSVGVNNSSMNSHNRTSELGL